MNAAQTIEREQLLERVALLENQANNLTTYNNELSTHNNELSIKNRHLKDQIEWFQRHLFGRRSERLIEPSNQLDLFPELLSDLEHEEEKPVRSYTRRPRKKGTDTLTFPEDLPVERIVMDLLEKEKTCSSTGKALSCIGETITRKLAYKPGAYFIKEYIRPKYALAEEEGIITSELPDQLLPKCRADESLLAELVVKKFADHLPLYRIAEILSRERIQISRQLLSQWMIALGEAVKPLCEEMEKQIKKQEVLHIDESPVKLQVKGRGKTHQATMWVRVAATGPPLRLYDFRYTRKHDHAKTLLSNYHGHVHSDKYGAYETLAKEKLYTWCPCWAHIRRKFIEAEEGPTESRKYILRKIKYLFMYERVAQSRQPEERSEIREKEILIIDELISKAKEELANPRCLPKSRWSKALKYFYGLEPYLKNYTTHPYARLDNNAAERAIRPLALGRKNWLFVGSEAGGQAAARLLSLVQTCRAMKINPQEYLEDVFRRLQGHNSQKLDELLPGKWSKQ